jgi:uncharacterized lipoprotein YmbA
MVKWISIAALVVLAACASHEAPMASGEWQVLNAGQWDINPSLVRVPDSAQAR